MGMQRCPSGHFFDADKYSRCPYCANPDINMTPTKPLGASPAPGGGGDEVPTRARGGAGGDDQKTVGLVREKLGIDPVVGWLVCVDGPDKGRDFRIKTERNFIGRAKTMDICIPGDQSIARDNHAIVVFDPMNQSFTLLPGDGRGIVYVNDEAVHAPRPLDEFDTVRIGKSTLRFVPFCGDRFQWELEAD